MHFVHSSLNRTNWFIEFPKTRYCPELCFVFVIVEIAEVYCTSCNKSEDFFVVPLNLKQFETHSNLTDAVLRKFKKVRLFCVEYLVLYIV